LSESGNHIEVKMSSEKGFGLVFAVVFFLIGFFPVMNAGTVRLWALIVAFGFLVLAYLAPRLLSVPNKLWFKLGMALGAVVAPIVMALVYFVSIVPIGLIIRLTGKDPLRRKLDQNAKTYWIERDQPVGTMKDQF